MVCERLEQWAFQLNRKIHMNETIRFHINYKGYIHNDLVGFYVNRHFNEKGNEMYVNSS